MQGARKSVHAASTKINYKTSDKVSAAIVVRLKPFASRVKKLPTITISNLLAIKRSVSALELQPILQIPLAAESEVPIKTIRAC